MKLVVIELRDSEERELLKLADKLSEKLGVPVSPEMILEQFVADLTHSPRSRGSDERDHAEAYVRRTF